MQRQLGCVARTCRRWLQWHPLGMLQLHLLLLRALLHATS